MLERLLAKDPADRYADYIELAADLRRFEPVDYPAAGRVVRALAWLVDLVLIYGVQQVLVDGLMALPLTQFVSQRLPILSLTFASLWLAAPILASYLQAWWGTTPGKRLFHIQIVGTHGLPPGKPTLTARAIAQFLPVWTTATWQIIELFDNVLPQSMHPLADTFQRLLFLIATLVLLADAAWSLYRPGQSLHDRIFRTRVVLDTGRRA